MANTWGNNERLYFSGLQNHCRWWLKPWNKKKLTSWKESYDQPNSILKSWDITLPKVTLTKIHPVKAMIFPIVIYGCESWTLKKGERWRIDAFELWFWRRLLRVPWTARRSNQSILMEAVLNIHWREWCWSWNSNILATWCEELTHLKRPWYWERLKAEGEGDDRGRQRMRWLDGITNSLDIEFG